MDPDPRTRLRETALDRFGRQGVQATSTREIIEAAGMRNPSAISYYFETKARLIEDLVAELVVELLPVLERQIELAARTEPPSMEDWAAIPVEACARLLATERGCLLARVGWEYDSVIRPSGAEEFLTSGDPIGSSWIMAVLHAMPDFPPRLAVFRNLTMFRTLSGIVALRASRILGGFTPGAMRIEDDAFQQVMQEIAVGVLSTPTKLTNEVINPSA